MPRRGAGASGAWVRAESGPMAHHQGTRNGLNITAVATVRRLTTAVRRKDEHVHENRDHDDRDDDAENESGAAAAGRLARRSTTGGVDVDLAHALGPPSMCRGAAHATDETMSNRRANPYPPSERAIVQSTKRRSYARCASSATPCGSIPRRRATSAATRSAVVGSLRRSRSGPR